MADGKQYVIELKIWRGDEYNKRGEKQLAEYLDYYHYAKALYEVFKYIGVPVDEIGYNQPKGVRYPDENPWGQKIEMMGEWKGTLELIYI